MSHIVKIRQKSPSLLFQSLLRSVPLSIYKRILESSPTAFGIEPANICNAECSFCAYPFMKRPKTIMPQAVYERAIHAYHAAGGGDLNLTPTVGDPLVDKELISKIRYARQYETIRDIFFYTNLIGLNPSQVDALLQSGVTRIAVSTFFGDPENYRRYYGRDLYHRVIGNLSLLTQRNAELGRPVSISLHLRIEDPARSSFRDNPDYRNIANLVGEENIAVMTRFDNWSERITLQDIPKGCTMDPPPREIKEPCGELYRRIHILADGRVGVCVCRDLDAEIVIGDITREDLTAIWRGNRLKQYRSSFEKGKPPKVCKGCSMYQPVNRYIGLHRETILRSFFRGWLQRLRKKLRIQSGRASDRTPSGAPI